MAGILANLLSGSRAMSAQSKGAEVAGKNLANLNNTSYSRERIDIQSTAMVQTGFGTESSGVQASGAQQLRDKFLDAAVLRENSDTGSAQALNDALTRAQTALGERLDRTTDTSAVTDTAGAGSAGIQSALSDFFTSFQSLAANPSDPSARQAVLQNANTLATRLNAADSRLAQVQTDTTAQISDDVKTVNGVLQSIATLNAQIAAAENGVTGQAPELRDQRQAKLEELAGYVNFTVSPDTAASGGTMQISVQDSSGNPVPLVQGGNVVGNVAFDGTNFTTGAPPTNLGLTSGSLEANLAVRTGPIQGVRDQLASLATQLTQAVNTAYNPSGATGNFFATPPASGLLAVDPSVTVANLKATDTGTSGGNELALAVAGVSTKAFATSGGDAIDGTASGFFSTVVSGLGGQVSSSNVNLENQQLLQSAVTDQRDSVSGVSLDEETTDLLRYQRAFQASARFVTIMDDLLNTVVNQLGAT
jgi:flagellar hook-associated protein 1 FlgK